MPTRLHWVACVQVLPAHILRRSAAADQLRGTRVVGVKASAEAKEASGEVDGEVVGGDGGGGDGARGIPDAGAAHCRWCAAAETAEAAVAMAVDGHMCCACMVSCMVRVFVVYEMGCTWEGH